MRKLKWVLLLFIVVALFAGCDVWISFWGSSAGISVDVYADASSLGVASDEVLRATLYRRNSSGFYDYYDQLTGISGYEWLNDSFSYLSAGTYKVTVYRDRLYTPNVGSPDFGTERGQTTLGFVLDSRDNYASVSVTGSAWSNTVTSP